MTTLVFGSSGYFGRLLSDVLPDTVGSDTDIADAVAVAEDLDRHRPDVVVNCAGKTGRPNVDWCESHREETLHSNVTGPLVLLEACLARGCYLVHLSSGCLYQGDNGGRGYQETDPPNFTGSFYSRTKAYADQILAEFPVLILRPRMPFDDSLHNRSLFGKLVHYQRVLDAENSFTYVPDFLLAAQELIAGRQVGVFHVVNPGTSSPYRMMLRYREFVDPDHEFECLSADELDCLTTAQRSSCVLSTDKLVQHGIRLGPLDDAIDQALRAIAKSR